MVLDLLMMIGQTITPLSDRPTFTFVHHAPVRRSRTLRRVNKGYARYVARKTIQRTRTARTASTNFTDPETVVPWYQRNKAPALANAGSRRTDHGDGSVGVPDDVLGGVTEERPPGGRTDAQRAGTARALYETQPTFRAAIDECAEILRPLWRA